MNLNQCEVLIRVLECGTMSAAADELGYTQSGISRLIGRLEEDLGFQLLLREKNGVRLTSEGELVLPLIRSIAADTRQLTALAREISGLEKGLIRIGTFNSASAQWLPGMIREFCAEYPGMQFELVHGTDEQTMNWLMEGRIDLNFTDYPADADVEEILLIRDPIVSIFAEEDPHARLERITPKELEQVPYISLNEGVDDEITRIIHSNDLHLQTRFIESDDHAVVAMVEQGLGTSLMSEMMIQGFSARIRAVPLDPPAWRSLGIACRDRARLSAAAAAFMDHIVDWIRRRYPGEETE